MGMGQNPVPLVNIPKMKKKVFIGMFTYPIVMLIGINPWQYMCVYIYMCDYIYIYICTYVYICKHVYVHVYIYIIYSIYTKIMCTSVLRRKMM